MPEKPFAYFEYNDGVWEQVIDEAVGFRGVIAAYLSPVAASSSVLPNSDIVGFSASCQYPDGSIGIDNGMRYRKALEAIRDALLRGDVCYEMAWFD